MIVKDQQRDPVRGSVRHLDLLKVRLDEKIQATVALELEGVEDAPGVREGGVLEHVTREVMVEALPTDIPDRIVANVAEHGHRRDHDARRGRRDRRRRDHGRARAEIVVATITAPSEVETEEEIEEEAELVGEEGGAEGEEGAEGEAEGEEAEAAESGGGEEG